MTSASAEAWYAPSVTWAASEGIVTGYDDGTFGPITEITREQLDKMITRYMDPDA